MRSNLEIKGDLPNLPKDSKRFFSGLSRKVANMAKNHYREGFKRGGYMTDNSRGGWKERKRQDKDKRRRAILVKTGHLRRDVDIISISINTIVLGTRNTKYASYHNKGTDILPRREFLGDSRELNRDIILYINRQFEHNFK